MTTTRTLLLLPLLAILTGCCGGGKIHVAAPPPLAIQTVEPRGIANRILTSMLMVSPVATAQPPARVYLHPAETGSESIDEALAIFRQKLGGERTIQLVESPGEAQWQLQPMLDAEAAPPVLTVTMSEADATVWSYRQELR